VSHRVTKTYGHELGLSATFRQWRAKSHCRFIHGYALGFKLVFEADELDENGWVKDFGGLKPLKQRLVDMFDHRMLVAKDDPALPFLRWMGGKSPAQNLWPLGFEGDGHWHPLEPLVQFVEVNRVGCEAFAQIVWDWADELIADDERARGVRLVEVECREHAGNAASYTGGEVRERA
jgi:6-pyruvoyltetrahydropterin/6-carboxytetrahydropterin synthase